MICKIVKSFVLWQKIQPTTGLTWMTFYESWVFRFRCSTGTNEKRLYSTDTVVRAVFFKASNSEENYKTVNWGVQRSIQHRSTLLNFKNKFGLPA